jgi:integrase/recombinase XerC
VPRPIAPAEVIALAEDVAENRDEAWIAARDYAVLLLLYGSGLRIAEALGLTGAALPLGDVLSVTGKRAKTRVVPLLEPVRAAVERYVALCPYPMSNDLPLFRGAAAGRSTGRSSGARCVVRGSGSACPGAPRRTRCGTALRPICSAAASTCARCRSCSAIPR